MKELKNIVTGEKFMNTSSDVRMMNDILYCIKKLGFNVSQFSYVRNNLLLGFSKVSPSNETLNLETIKEIISHRVEDAKIERFEKVENEEQTYCSVVFKGTKNEVQYAFLIMKRNILERNFYECDGSIVVKNFEMTSEFLDSVINN